MSSEVTLRMAKLYIPHEGLIVLRDRNNLRIKRTSSVA